MSEKEIETSILTWLNYQQHCFAFKVNTVGIWDEKRQMYRKNQNPFVIPGTSDVFSICYGKFVALEVKTPITIKRYLNYPTKRDLDQRAFLDQVNLNGGLGKCVSSLDEVIKIVTHIKLLVGQGIKRV